MLNVTSIGKNFSTIRQTTPLYTGICIINKPASGWNETETIETENITISDIDFAQYTKPLTQFYTIWPILDHSV